MIKKLLKKLTPKKRIRSTSKVKTKARFVNESNIKKLASLNQKEFLKQMDLESFGLTDAQYEHRVEKYGNNEINRKGFPWFLEFLKAFFGPFSIILLVISIYNFVSYFTNRFGTETSHDPADLVGALIVLSMIVVSGLITYIQAIKTYYSTKKISGIIRNKTNIIRLHHDDSLADFKQINKQNQLDLIKLGEEMDVSVLVPGDLIYLSSGDMVPADVRVIYSNDLFINQSSLTGESLPVEKHATDTTKSRNILDLEDICFTGTSVISGSALVVAIATGNDTYFATISKAIEEKRQTGGFVKGVNKVTRVLIFFMLIIVPIVFLINGFVGMHRPNTTTTDAWLNALFFAIAAAVGLTPEMLPMIVTTNLANGASKMAKQKVVVKNLDAIQALGAIDILATDKTGTLTNDKIKMEECKTVDQKNSPELMKYLFINSYFQTGLKNPMDNAIIEQAKADKLDFNVKKITKIDEIPFDFNRRKLTIVADIPQEGRIMITKGSMEEILSISTKVYYNGKVQKLTDDLRRQITAYYEKMNGQGKRVLGVGIKKVSAEKNNYTVKDEGELTFFGYATFLDTPKTSTKKMIKILKKYGVSLKILTGDNEAVTRAVAKMVDLKIDGLVTGEIIENASEYELKKIVENNNVFVKLNPLQKVKILQVLKENGHTVGYMGDGINDAPVLRQSDVAISVANATDIAKDASDIILLEKSLLVLEKGIIQGRTIFGNILKYIKLTTASNFGNTLSLIIASAWLPFLPMIPVQILFQNLLYDLSQLTMALDRVDESFIKAPQEWRAKEIIPFALINGPVSSVFDVAVFAIMGYTSIGNYAIPTVVEQGALTEASKMAIGQFQAAWFMEGLMTQALVVQVLRSEKVPYFQTWATWPVNLSTGVVIAMGAIIGFTPQLANLLSMTPPPAVYAAILVGLLVGYMTLAELTKLVYKKIFKSWI